MVEKTEFWNMLDFRPSATKEEEIKKEYHSNHTAQTNIKLATILKDKLQEYVLGNRETFIEDAKAEKWWNVNLCIIVFGISQVTAATGSIALMQLQDDLRKKLNEYRTYRCRT